MKLQLTHLTLTSLSFLTRSLSIIDGKPNKLSLSLSLTVFQTLKQKINLSLKPQSPHQCHHMLWPPNLLYLLSTSSLDRSGKLPSSSLRLTSRRGDTPVRMGLVGSPSRLVGALHLWFVRSFRCPLSLGGGRYLFTFGSVARILAKF